MILSRGSLILGGLVMAVLAKKGSSMPEILPTPASSFSTSQAIPTGTPAMPSDSDPESQQAWFKSEWSLPQMAFATDLNITYNFQQSIDLINLDLVLCQTNATGSEPLTTDNTWSVLSLPNGTICNEQPQCLSNSPYGFSIWLYNGTSPNDSRSFFFCFMGTSNDPSQGSVCSSYSPFFDVLPLAQVNANLQAPAPSAVAAPTYEVTSTIDIRLHTAALDSTTVMSATTAQASISGLTTITSGGSTITEILTTVTNTTPISSSSPVAVSSTSSPSHSSGGLSTGAKVGIALGALFLAAILLLVALFFLRRKHSTRSQPEQVMLTRDMHVDSFSRNLIAEKEELNSSPLSGPSPVDHSLPIQRHSALSPYEPLPSAPYSGAAATAPSAIPRRKPTTATMSSTVSRGISNASTGSVLSPRSATTTGGAAGHEFEEYHDVPIYGDARHVPQLNTFSGASHSQAPFLGEEGVTAEEAARLEEEERRIDAAIEAAERERGNR